jgi:rhomboid family GlyGly-CTERM serine protease
MAGVLLLAAVAIVAIVAIIAQLSSPDIARALEWKRESMGAGIPWGVLTGHLAHWSWNHLVWDLVAFVGLSFACLRVRPRRFIVCLGLSAIAIPIVVFVFHPELATYRGLSGIDSALFALFITGLWRVGSPGPRFLNGARLLALVGAVLFLAKTVFEILSGQTLFVQSGEAGFVPVPSAHLAGFVAGLVAALGVRWPEGTRQRLDTALDSSRGKPHVAVKRYSQASHDNETDLRFSELRQQLFERGFHHLFPASFFREGRRRCAAKRPVVERDDSLQANHPKLSGRARVKLVDCFLPSTGLTYAVLLTLSF